MMFVVFFGLGLRYRHKGGAYVIIGAIVMHNRWLDLLIFPQLAKLFIVSSFLIGINKSNKD